MIFDTPPFLALWSRAAPRVARLAELLPSHPAAPCLVHIASETALRMGQQMHGLIDPILESGFAVITSPAAHATGDEVVAGWRCAFAVAAVMKAALLLARDADGAEEAVRLADCALLLGGGGTWDGGELGRVCHPLIRLAVRRCGGRSTAAVGAAGLRRGGRRRRREAMEESGVGEAVGDAAGSELDLAAAVERAVIAGRGVKLLGAMEDWGARRSWAADMPALRRALALRWAPAEVGVHTWSQGMGHMPPAQAQQRLVRLDTFIDNVVLGADPALLSAGATRPLAITASVPVTAAKCTGYVAQHLLVQSVPELLAGIGTQVLRVAGDADPDATRWASRAWLGPAGTVTPLHFDHHDNVLCQLLGSKLILLVYGEDAAMYPCAEVPNASMVDAERPDADRFPLFSATRRTCTILGPGEAIFIPRGVWHCARSLSPSLSISMWFQRP